MYDCHSKRFSGLCTRIDRSHLAVFCIDRNAIGCYDFVRIVIFEKSNSVQFLTERLLPKQVCTFTCPYGPNCTYSQGFTINTLVTRTMTGIPKFVLKLRYLFFSLRNVNMIQYVNRIRYLVRSFKLLHFQVKKGIKSGFCKFRNKN